ncbi:MAG: Stk1 family PASTA domain-containing Ser/Thr kinase [Bacillota bacterium]
MTGKIFGNRYHLLEQIGEGGMALVFKAEDTLLYRTVAVKVLRPQYASDIEFVERFRREARAAASLSHPNIVSIYDVGQEEGLDYLVMEYIPGNNLKNIIRQQAPLPIDRALDYTRQIAEALHHAHQRNIVHRDIKPHNILITPDGLVKVTDFGIARAISASSFTQAGVVVGSVQYSSPEQAKGGIVGPQSDLYSLGCVLYEMLTGEVPFQGDTSVAIALKHIQESFVPIQQLRPEVSPSVSLIVEKATAKELEERYPSALAMLKDITLASSQSSREIKLLDDTDLPTQVWRRVDAEKPERSGRKALFLWLLTGLGTLAILAFLFLYFINFLLPPRPEVAVPNLVGQDLSKAREVLNQSKLKLRVVNRLYNSNYPAGMIISQKPSPGTEKRIYSEVEVVLSRGPQLVRVPDLTGKTQIEAELALEEAGLKLGDILTVNQPDSPEGTVVKQLPAGETQIEWGASVSITLNVLNGNLVQVPNFIGRPLSEVRAELGSLGLVFNQATPTQNDIYPEGVVVDQKPVPYDKVALGTAMNFIVSAGPHPR